MQDYMLLILVVIGVSFFVARLATKSFIENKFIEMKEKAVIILKSELDTKKDEKIEILKAQLLTAKDTEIEMLKSQSSRDTEVLKKELELEQIKTKMIFDSQKDSFRKIIGAMERIIAKLSQYWDPDEGDYKRLLSEVEYWELRSGIIEETLYLSPQCARVIDEFFRSLQSFVDWGLVEERSSADWLRNRHNELAFIFEDILDYFRAEIGLIKNDKPLYRTQLLIAINLINHAHFQRYNFPTTLLYFKSKDKTINERIVLAERHNKALLDELNRLKICLSDAENSNFLDTLLDVETSISFMKEAFKVREIN